MHIFKILIGISLVLWSYFLWSRRKFYLLYIKMRGPLGLPFLGSVWNLRGPKDVEPFFAEAEKRYGQNFVMWLGTAPILNIAEPEMVEAILTSPHFIDKASVYDSLNMGMKSGLFTLKNPLWSIHRKLLNPTFNHKVLMSFIPVFNGETNNLIAEMNHFVGTGEVDIRMTLQNCTINVASQTTMGKQMASIKDRDKDLLHHFQRILQTIISIIWFPWLKLLFLSRMTDLYRLFKKSKDTIMDFIKNLIEEKVSKLDTSENTSTRHSEDFDIKKNPNIFIDRALELVRNGDLTWQDLESESLVIVAGAFETTANTVGFVLILLAMFPEYQEKLYEEILSIYPDVDIDVTYEDIQQMTYMDMVLNETMRVLAPVPMVGREAMCDVSLSNGIVLPKGLQVSIDIFHMHRDPKYWGPEAMNFNPDNFLPTNMADKHPYVFIPFTKGIRNCIGQRYALISIKIILAKLLRMYRFTTKFDFKDLVFVEEITLLLEKFPLLEVHLRES